MVISFLNYKGGPGKTTLAISFAAGLANKGKKVLVIDLDAQGNATRILSPRKVNDDESIYNTIVEDQPLSIHATKRENQFLVPVTKKFGDAERALGNLSDADISVRLKKHLDEIKNDYDFVIIDCPPELRSLNKTALIASDKVLLIINPDLFSLDGLVHAKKVIDVVKENEHPALEILGIVMNRCEGGRDGTRALRISHGVVTEHEEFKNLFIPILIPKSTDIPESQLLLQDVYAFNPKSKVIEAIDRIIEKYF